MNGSRGLRNNNPGNIRRNSDHFKGEVIPSQDRDFKQFESMAYGYRAMFKILTNYYNRYGLKTIRQLISRWAPPSENETEIYIRRVSDWSGIPAEKVIDITVPEPLTAIVAAMSRMENGVAAVMEDVKAGWKLLHE